VTEPEEKTGGLLDRWWARLLVAAWIVAVLAIYFRLQIMRVLTMAGVLPNP
jgi:hypothetical protein